MINIERKVNNTRVRSHQLYQLLGMLMVPHKVKLSQKINVIYLLNY